MEAGIRAVYAHGVPVGGHWWANSSLEHHGDIRRIRKQYFQSDDQLLTLALAAPGNTTADVARHDWLLARDLGIRISVHVGMRLTGVHVQHVLTLKSTRFDGSRYNLHPLHGFNRRRVGPYCQNRWLCIGRAVRRNVDGIPRATAADDPRMMSINAIYLHECPKESVTDLNWFDWKDVSLSLLSNQSAGNSAEYLQKMSNDIQGRLR